MRSLLGGGIRCSTCWQWRCARVTAAGHDLPVAIAEWAAGCSQDTLTALGGRRDGWIRPPSVRTFSRIFGRGPRPLLSRNSWSTSRVRVLRSSVITPVSQAGGARTLAIVS
jgi:hypothetical protein